MHQLLYMITTPSDKLFLSHTSTSSDLGHMTAVLPVHLRWVESLEEEVRAQLKGLSHLLGNTSRLDCFLLLCPGTALQLFCSR